MTKQEGAALAPPLPPVLNEQGTHTYIVENACSQKRKISYVIQYVHVSRSRIRIMIERNKCTSQHFSKNTHSMYEKKKKKGSLRKKGRKNTIFCTLCFCKKFDYLLHSILKKVVSYKTQVLSMPTS